MASSQTDVPDICKAKLYLSAVCAVEDGMSTRKAANKYKVMRESLRLRVHDYGPVDRRRGPQLVYMRMQHQRGAQRFSEQEEGSAVDEDVLSYRKGRILDVKRAECSTEENVRVYFQNLSAAILKFNLLDEPAQIWKCDETGVTAQGNCNDRVICPNDMSANIQRSSDRENVSIMG
ncbi:hypothetical protein AM587_10014336 [Phytophthora nicotianae]|uniref:HTH psq-type domain-containing protein n=1 Tax=Phytophthora nicotianae TaxID=4792 RepID=A0A0W8C9U4_PHYNI|nr:hypothetical protein AM587_10014336 [Phytophthora nicotianae]